MHSKHQHRSWFKWLSLALTLLIGGLASFLATSPTKSDISHGVGGDTTCIDIVGQVALQEQFDQVGRWNVLTSSATLTTNGDSTATLQVTGAPSASAETNYTVIYDPNGEVIVNVTDISEGDTYSVVLQQYDVLCPSTVLGGPFLGSSDMAVGTSDLGETEFSLSQLTVHPNTSAVSVKVVVNDTNGDGAAFVVLDDLKVVLSQPGICPLLVENFDLNFNGIFDNCEISDLDNDGIADENDNCVNTPNPNQEDADNDGIGDACDNDADNDGVADDVDNCVNTSNPNQEDADNDGIGDACDNDADNDGVTDDVDNCVNSSNPNQEDADNDGIGDACDNDADNDGVADDVDNCVNTPNADQADVDNDGIGDACDPINDNPEPTPTPCDDHDHDDDDDDDHRHHHDDDDDDDDDCDDDDDDRDNDRDDDDDDDDRDNDRDDDDDDDDRDNDRDDNDDDDDDRDSKKAQTRSWDSDDDDDDEEERVTNKKNSIEKKDKKKNKNKNKKNWKRKWKFKWKNVFHFNG